MNIRTRIFYLAIASYLVFISGYVGNIYAQQPVPQPINTSNFNTILQNGDFGDKRKGDKVHEGIDVSAPAGTEVKTTIDGKVIAAGTYGDGSYVKAGKARDVAEFLNICYKSRMPRQARIDVPGHLYHVIARGIERGKIFVDDDDYIDFLSRLEKKLDKTGSKCYAFSLLPNHFHLLVLRGHRPLAELMRRLMTGYAVRFNLKHKRAGHLFQNRYKAILCEIDSYFLELVAYIHLNPLRAGVVKDLDELRRYRWCGHSVVMGQRESDFLAKEEILRQFGNEVKGARRKYESYITERVNKFKPGDLSGGGLIRSIGRLSTEIGFRGKEDEEMFDERVLGRGDFVASVLQEAEKRLQFKGTLEEVMKQVVKDTGIEAEAIFNTSRVRAVVRARALYCYLAKERCGTSGTQLMKQLRLTSGAISHLISQGREIHKAIY